MSSKRGMGCHSKSSYDESEGARILSSVLEKIRHVDEGGGCGVVARL